MIRCLQLPLQVFLITYWKIELLGQEQLFLQKCMLSKHYVQKLPMKQNII